MTDYNSTEMARMAEITRLREVCANLRCDNEQLARDIFWFIYNWPADFIEKCWHDDLHMQQHLTDKFSGLYARTTPDSALLKFYHELDNIHRSRFIEYILSLTKAK